MNSRIEKKTARRGGIVLGRLLGIDIVLDHTWLVLLALLSWNLTVVFRTWHPMWSVRFSFGMALASTLLFLLSILAHEMAHSIVATSLGIPVREIRVFLFGGVSDLEREPPSAASEFWMAIVGPLVSLGGGMTMLMVAYALMASSAPIPSGLETLAPVAPLPTLALWLAWINIGMGFFNLIPGFPLDGGRVLRALLWRITGSLHKATLQAATVGQAIGWLFVAMGVAMFLGVRFPFFGSGQMAGLWVAFIGWFLRSAAVRSYRDLLVHDVLEGVTVERLMRPCGDVLPADATLDSAARQWFIRSSQRALPVMDHGRWVGMVSLSDLRCMPESLWDRASITTVMTPVADLTMTSPSEDVIAALRKFVSTGVEQLPVMQNGKLAGMLERRDVAGWLEIRFMAPHLAIPRAA